MNRLDTRTLLVRYGVLPLAGLIVQIFVSNSTLILSPSSLPAPLPPLFFSSFPITKAYMHTTHSLGVATQPSHPRSPLLPFVRHFSLPLARILAFFRLGKKNKQIKKTLSYILVLLFCFTEIHADHWVMVAPASLVG